MTQKNKSDGKNKKQGIFFPRLLDTVYEENERHDILDRKRF